MTTPNLVFNAPLRPAQRLAPIEIPLFDPPYVVPRDIGWGFQTSSPVPHFDDGSAYDPATGLFVYKKSGVLTPFQMTLYTEGNAGPNPISSYGPGPALYGVSEVMLKNVAGPTIAKNVLATGGPSLVKAAMGPNYQWSGANGPADSSPCFFWIGAGDNPTLFVGFSSLEPGPGQHNGTISAAPLIAGGFPFSTPRWNDGTTIASLVGTFMLQRTKPVIITLGLLTTNSLVNNSAYHILPMQFSYSPPAQPAQTASQVQSIVFDDPNLNGGFGITWQMSEYGLLGSWASTAYSIIPGQASQHILLTAKFDPQLLFSGDFPNLQYAPILLRPKTDTAGAAASWHGVPDIKIDPLGIFYFHPGSTFSTPGRFAVGGSYVANSAGLDISMPGVNATIGEPLPMASFCPCSPVAIPVGGG